MSSNYLFKAKKSQPGTRCYVVVRNFDEAVIGEVFRHGAEPGWTSCDVGGTEAWPFSDRESAAQMLDHWHAKAIERLAAATRPSPFVVVGGGTYEPETDELDLKGLDPLAIWTAFVDEINRDDEPEMIEDVQLTLDDFDTAQSMTRFLVESFGAGLGPVFSCAEAEAIVCLAESCGLEADLIARFKGSHVADDEPGDLHADGWPAEQTLGPEDSEETS